MSKKRPRQSRGRAGKQWFGLAVISARHIGKPPWRPSGLPWGAFRLLHPNFGANPLCAAGRDNFSAAAGEASVACLLQAGTLLCKTAPASGGSYACCKRVRCFVKPRNAPLPKPWMPRRMQIAFSAGVAVSHPALSEAGAIASCFWAASVFTLPPQAPLCRAQSSALRWCTQPAPSRGCLHL